MKQLFAYIRVSDPKQGKGVSLDEQRSIIEAHAARIGATIIEWFVEKKTAAKTGRTQFARLVKLLRAGKADGVVIHKVDRSSRNFRDWADIDELIENGIDVQFANENMDLRSRGGRLAADIEMVFAVDYIRNLREETLKGILGRLKQGILPHNAPIGYLDCGPGKPKAVDPSRGPLIRQLFERYATGGHTLRMLVADSTKLGLRNRNGNPLRLTQIHAMLRNPFYAGILRSARFGVFQGAHEALVTRATYDRVQTVLAGKIVRRTRQHIFLFRRMLRCSTCGRSLIGSKQKSFVYYRCSRVECPTTSVREDRVETQLRNVLMLLTFSAAERSVVEGELAALLKDQVAVRTSREASLSDALSAVNARLARLTDLLLDAKIDAAAHDERRESLLIERREIENGIASVESGAEESIRRAQRIVELADRAENLYESADAEQKRKFLTAVMSNCVVTGKSVDFTLAEPFASIARRHFQQTCAPDWYTDRTFAARRLVELAGACSRYLQGFLDRNGFTYEVELRTT